MMNWFKKLMILIHTMIQGIYTNDLVKKADCNTKFNEIETKS